MFTPDATYMGLIAAMQEYWVRSAAADDSNGGGRAPWPAYNPAAELYLEFGLTTAARSGLGRVECDFRDGLAP